MCLDDLDNHLDWDRSYLDEWEAEDPNTYYQEMDRLLEAEDEEERQRAKTPLYYALCEHYQMSPGGA